MFNRLNKKPTLFSPLKLDLIKTLLVKFFKILGIILGVIVVLLIALILFIRSPWGQGIIVDKAISFVSEKTGTEVALDRLFITFSGNIYIEGLYLEDTNGDTLVYSKNLEAGLAFVPLINSGNINVTKLDWEGVVAKVTRSAETEKFNFDFLIEAFASQPADSTQTAAADTTASDPLQIKLAPISLRDFDIQYDDKVMGIDASLILGQLDVAIPSIDLETYEFEIENVALSRTQLNYNQTKPFPPSESPEGESVMPKVKLDEFTLTDVTANYTNVPASQTAQLQIGDLLVELPLADLSTQTINLSTIELNNSNILYHDFSTVEASEPIASDTSSAAFVWPDWKVNVDQISLENNVIEFKTADTDFRKGYFNPSAFRFTELNAVLGNIIFESEKAEAEIEVFRFEEASGFSLKEFSVGLLVNNSQAMVENLQLAINRSQLTGDLKVSYESIEKALAQPELADIDLQLNSEKLQVADAYFFLPELAQDTLIQKLQEHPFALNVDASGSSDLLKISSLDLSWGATSMFASGQLSEILDMDKLRFDIPQIRLESDRETITTFISEADLGLQVPDEVLLTGQASGSLSDLGTEMSLESTFGNLDLIASYQDQNQLSFSTNIQAKAIQLNQLLQNEDLDTVYFSLDASGSGATWYEINATLQAKFDSIGLYQNDFSGLALSADIENGSGTVSSNLESENLRYDLSATIDLDSINSQADLKLNLKGADFNALGLTAKNTKAEFMLDASFTGNLEEYQANATITDATVVHEQKVYPVGTVWVNAFVKNDSTSIDLESRPVVGFLQSNANPAEFSTALSNYLTGYFNLSDSATTSGDVVLNMNIAIRQDPLLNEVLIPSLVQLDDASVKANFSEAGQTLTADINFPFLNYSGVEIDSLGVAVRSDSSGLDFKFGFASLLTGPIDMDKTLISGDLDESQMLLDIQFFDEEEVLTQVSSEIDFLPDSLQIKFLPENLILNKIAWDVPQTNRLTFSSQEITLRDMLFTSANQQIELTDKLDSLERPHIAALFDGFQLKNLTSFLNPETVLVNGDMQGSLIVQKPFGALGILGDLTIDSLAVMEADLGTLTLNAEAKSIGNYALAAGLKRGGIDLDILGDFKASEEAASFDLEVDLNRIDLAILENLLPEDIAQAGGVLEGRITANGTTLEPIYEGVLSFKDASVTPTILGTKYLFENESISLDNAGVYLDNFTIRDESKNTFTADGEIGTESLINPTLDLSVTAKRFLAINSTDKESELFFGKALIDADITVKGDLLLPIVRGNLAVKDATDLTFIIPESQAELVERKGVVVFVNKENEDAILTRNEEEISNSFAGYDINVQLEVDPTARFKIIIDPNSGDNLALTASGELDLTVDPVGRTSLSGRLQVESGHYELSLYNLVNRRFEIVSGSTVVWNGDPLDATLDISARYEVRTSPEPLMASQLTSSGDATQSQYGKRLDFLVYLYLDGELLKPEISFGLDMPENERGEFGGNVYSQVRQLGEQEGELNRQVFSLLVLNRFFPSGGSDGSGGGTEALARNSVSQLLSDQLNNFSNQLFGDSGFEVGFEVDSYTQGQGGKSQTELNVSAQQTLFDDRLTVQVGSQFDVEGNSQTAQNAGAILGNISIEYTLTEDGRFRIRAFRKNQFESIIDGQLVVTGMGLVFNREFNSFSQLWKSSITPEDEINTNPIDRLDNQSDEKEDAIEKKNSNKPEKNEQ